MAANIDTFATLRTPAWHGLGTVLTEKVSPLEFQKVAGLDWNADLVSLGLEGLEHLRAVKRSDNGKHLGVVGKDYATVQNDALFQYLQSLGEFDLELQVETAGALGQGEIVWALAKVPALSLSLGNDKVETYLTLVNGHTGNKALSIFDGSVRIVCANTMALAMQGRKGAKGLSKGWNLKHTSNIEDRISQTRAAIQHIIAAHAETKVVYSRLADLPGSWEQVEEMAKVLWGAIPTEEGRGRTIAMNRMQDLATIWNSPTIKGVETAGSLWSVLNTVTEWCEHFATFKGGTYSSQENKFITNIIGGTAASNKEEAYTYALKLAGI